MDAVMFWTWCIAIHCILWILIDPPTRNSALYVYNLIRWRCYYV